MLTMPWHPRAVERFGTRLKRLRLARGWPTPRAADHATGISSATWINLETRGNKPTLRTVDRLMTALDVSYDELVTGTDAVEDDREQAMKPPTVEEAKPPASRRRRKPGTQSDRRSKPPNPAEE